MSWDIPSVSGVAALVLTIFGILGKVSGVAGWVWQKVHRPRRDPGGPEVPKQTLILVPKGSANSSRWTMDLFGGCAVMRVVCETKATNICKHDVKVVSAKMRRPATSGRAVVVDQADQIDDQPGDGTIPALGVRDLRLEFAIAEAIVEDAKSFDADVAVIDQFGNEHWLTKVRFRRRASERVLSRVT